MAKNGEASVQETDSTTIQTSTYVFVLADEIDPIRRKLVRRVLVNPRMAAEASRNLGRPLKLFPNPERFGFSPSAPGNSAVSIGRHAMGMKPSPSLSTSSHLFGAKRFTGSPFWIDVAKAQQAGATIHETSDIAADLARISAKLRNSVDVQKVEMIKQLVQADGEVLLRGDIPAGAIKGSTAMALTRGLQGVQVIGFTMAAVNINHAAQKSFSQHSVRPIAAESIRQVGGWASAWAGIKIGGSAGALIGIETGPGAIVSAGIGSVIGGISGYFAFDWIADHLDQN